MDALRNFGTFTDLEKKNLFSLMLLIMLMVAIIASYILLYVKTKKSSNYWSAYKGIMWIAAGYKLSKKSRNGFDADYLKYLFIYDGKYDEKDHKEFVS